MSGERSRDALLDLDVLPLDRWWLTARLRNRAFDLADSLSPYGALSVALAEMADVPLVTRDGRMARAAERCVSVELVQASGW